ncbi:tRNA pseudouridine(13) synthase TruD [Thalassotalea sp. PS06]|uniref:tRNA pseudouridine(13) synthase TruD n=1 Tax=Thalassotalea sp. PS06 TaxID=2594005 RepID=UPI0011636C26|nr:tRNA pseudouridine(13) synthase TruD [Thalassotalea sp. PS06]QDP01997.1 tRNA pseudouridine(13) synthase TruD [Thalassotalea sp. PS06]
MNNELAYLYQKPQSTGVIRTNPEDFKVFEVLPFTFSGEGEHLVLHIRKTGANTTFVARQLARYFKVKDALVSYAGMKDRNAVTEQYFSIHLPGKPDDDISDLKIEGVEVLAKYRHNKKLKTGALSGNRFELVIRNVTDVDDIYRHWIHICKTGVPNYFGEQRFGINGNNLDRAKDMFAGAKVKDKKKRGFYLSAVRSYLFNQVLNQRIEQGLFSHLDVGDVMMMAGSQSVFIIDELNDDIQDRFNRKDIDLTAPMWGRGRLMTEGAAAEREQNLARCFPDLCEGLEAFGLQQERRRIRLMPTDADIQTANDNVKLSFFLPAGSFATTVLRELVDYQDASELKRTENHVENSGQ